ncbi:Autophagy protein 3 [Fasciola gigantica]|uniref:Autophagy protein 3 n=1 Tax=Fasciola gigantica TaxID=46835 RepID=A0A504YDQ0_FASGI|nr:Autophagy protein 3 [Fasciola gigantica]
MNLSASVTHADGPLNRQSNSAPGQFRKHASLLVRPSRANLPGSNELGETKEPVRVKVISTTSTVGEYDTKSCESESSSTRSSRKNGSSKHSRKYRCTHSASPPIYDSRGRRLGTLLDTCDCLRDSCPGCHLPCRRCHSMMCGPVCRSHRTFRFKEARALNWGWRGGLMRTGPFSCFLWYVCSSNRSLSSPPKTV